MKLMHELMTKAVQEEAEEVKLTSSEITRFKRIWDVVERDLDHLNSVMKEDSNFAKLVEKGGGDVDLFKAAIKSYEQLYDHLNDVHMSVGIQ
jgi:hypothetical protein